LKLVRPQSSRRRRRRQTMALAEEQEDVRGLRDNELPRLEKRRRKRRSRNALVVETREHQIFAVVRASDIDIARTGFLERKPDEFAASLNRRPIVQFVGHGGRLTVARRKTPDHSPNPR